MKKFLVSLAVPALLGITVSLISQSRISELSELTKTNVEALSRCAAQEVVSAIECGDRVCIVTNARNKFLRRGCKQKETHFCSITATDLEFTYDD